MPPIEACDLPAALPAPATPVAAPVVRSTSTAMLFSSYLYERGPDGDLFALDRLPDAWAIGLWFVAPGSTEARLLAAPTGGLIYPLALTAAGDKAAVWWHPSWRAAATHGCPAGIYVMSTAGEGGQLVTSDVEPPAAEAFDPIDTTAWQDWLESNEAELPRAAFSTNGQRLALVHGEEIGIYGPGLRLQERHAGVCGDWAWAPTRPIFVAGCDDMTTAWLVDANASTQFALPIPDLQLTPHGWEAFGGETIGFTSAGDVRLVRFWGVATDCPIVGDCSAIPPAYSVTTIDPDTLDTRSTAAAVDWIIAVGDPFNLDSRLAADGSWVYVETQQRRLPNRAIRLGTGEISAVGRVDAFGATTPDGLYLFGKQLDGLTGGAVVSSIDSSGSMREVGTIGWPDGATSEHPAIPTDGLIVVIPGS